MGGTGDVATGAVEVDESVAEVGEGVVGGLEGGGVELQAEGEGAGAGGGLEGGDEGEGVGGEAEGAEGVEEECDRAW